MHDIDTFMYDQIQNISLNNEIQKGEGAFLVKKYKKQSKMRGQ